MPRALRFAPAVLLATTALEIVVFVLVARSIGFGWAVLLVLAASMSGLLLLRREGMRAWRRFRTAAAGGAPPGAQATDGVVGLAGALLLAVPGLLTGVIGLLLVLPPGRPIARRGLTGWAERRLPGTAASDLFGPRRVRVRPGRPYPDPGPSRTPAPPPPVPGDGGGGGGGAIEGEIVEPR